MGGIIRVHLRRAQPTYANDAAEWSEHKLQLRFSVSAAKRAAPGGGEYH